MDWRKYITFEADKMGGQPCVRGMRITVYDILDYLASGMTIEQLLTDFPYLRKEDVQASLAFIAEMVRGTVYLPA